MSQCQKLRRTEGEARRLAEALTAQNEAEGYPQPQVYAYACVLCRGHWHVTSQPYHLVKKEEQMGNLAEVLDEDEGHDCLDNVEYNGINGFRCGECGEPIDAADAECTWCGRYPCDCDAAYERLKEDRMERGY